MTAPTTPSKASEHQQLAGEVEEMEMATIGETPGKTTAKVSYNVGERGPPLG